MSSYGEFKKFAKFLKKYGIERERTTNHAKLTRNGEIIYSMSGSPAVIEYAINNTIKDLVNIGQLPHGVVYKGITYKKKDAPKREGIN